MSVLTRLVGTAALIALSACSVLTGSPDQPQPPSAAQAQAALADAVRLARAGEFVSLCQLGGGNCETILDTAGRDRVPSLAPIVVLNEPMREAKGPNESGSARLLVVCGRGVDGDIYATEIAVVWQGAEVRAIEPIYWSGLSVSTAGGTGVHSELPAPSPAPECG